MNDCAQNPTPAYAELHCISNFTFLRGASHPEELIARAHALGYRALALTDECSLAGVVRAHTATKEHPIHFIVGSEFVLTDMRVVLLACNLNGYGALSELITRARRRAVKGRYEIGSADFSEVEDCLAIIIPTPVTSTADVRALAQQFPGRAWLGIALLREAHDQSKRAQVIELSRACNLPIVATGDVHMHSRGRRVLQDTLTAIRLGTPIAQAGFALHANGERHLRPRGQLSRLYPPEWLAQSVTIAAQCRFSLNELRYEYPREWLPPQSTPSEYLHQLVLVGAQRRWPQGVPEKVRALLTHELSLVAELCYEAYFLTVHDLVQFARSRGILCQGRGSAANSAVCYCLYVTEVDPARSELLFERFISKERDEPPDIDVDFEHERREEVIQYIYQKYGRERAALAATVITYRTRSALRDVAKALGLDLTQVERLAKSLAWWEGRESMQARARAAGFDVASPVMRRLFALTEVLVGFPRHLSQHVGGMVMAHTRLSRMVPIENAAMEGRTVIQWDKNDLDDVGLLKVDCLALGMLTAIRKTLDLIAHSGGPRLQLADIGAEDAAVYRMMQRADTVGVFQIESRAQMSMLPRLKPKTFYDLVVQIAIVRPGPIQGGMVHPYLRRRENKEAISYPHPDVRAVLERTLGVPIFQEQVIKLAMVAAGFTPGEADRLRRSMAAWHRRGGLGPFEQRLIDGMLARGYTREYAQQIFSQIEGFGEYGFPESHSASFALLAYSSAWLKHYYPTAFVCGLLNSQPMGFYAPAQLIYDAQRHGVEVHAADVCHSDWDCSLEPTAQAPALRLGLRIVKGLARAAAERLLAARAQAAFTSVGDLATRARLTRREIAPLARAGALRSLVRQRHRASWGAQAVQAAAPLFAAVTSAPEALPLLPKPTAAQEVLADYAGVGLSLSAHPLSLWRGALRRGGVLSSRELGALGNGAKVRIAGLVTCRQRPGTASGVIFITLEDETGTMNVIVWRDMVERYRAPLLQSPLLIVEGQLQRAGGTMHVVAQHMRGLPALPPTGEEAIGEIAARADPIWSARNG